MSGPTRRLLRVSAGQGLPLGGLQPGLQLAGGGGGGRVPECPGPRVLCGPAAGLSGHPGEFNLRHPSLVQEGSPPELFV